MQVIFQTVIKNKLLLNIDNVFMELLCKTGRGSKSTNLYLRGERNIKSGQTITYYRNSGSDEYLFKYKAGKTGKVTVSFSYEYGSYLRLLNSK